MKKPETANVVFAMIGYSLISVGVFYSGAFAVSRYTTVCAFGVFPFVASTFAAKVLDFRLAHCLLMTLPTVSVLGFFAILHGEYLYLLEALLPLELFVFLGFQVVEFLNLKKSVRG